MPASHDRLPNNPLSGKELKHIILRDVTAILEKDGLFNSLIGFNRVSFETRVTVHMDNPVYPEHVVQVLSRRQSLQEIQADPALAAIEPPPLKSPSEDDALMSEERHREIASPNMARVEHGLPIVSEKFNHDTGKLDRKEHYYEADAETLQLAPGVGNKVEDRTTNDDQNRLYGRKGKKK